MKKTLLIFCLISLANLNSASGAYFYSDVVEQAIQTSFPSEVQADVAAEYEAQMNPDTGEIDTNGIMNVCYAGGFDVTTDDGAAECANFVQTMAGTCPYTISGAVYDNNGDKILKDTDPRSFIDYYNNPQTNEEKLRKCVLDKTIDWAIKSAAEGGGNEGGFQQTRSDKGNRICDKNGNPLTDSAGHYLLGATNFGITTCASGLSVACIKNMTKADAKKYYWTRHFMKMRYYRLPIEIQALVMEMSISGIGNAGKAFRCTLDGKPASWGNYPVVTNDPVNALQEWETSHSNGERDAFKRRYTGMDLVNGKNCVPVHQERRKRAYEHLKDIYKTCANELGISWVKPVTKYPFMKDPSTLKMTPSKAS